MYYTQYLYVCIYLDAVKIHVSLVAMLLMAFLCAETSPVREEHGDRSEQSKNLNPAVVAPDHKKLSLRVPQFAQLFPHLT